MDAGSGRQARIPVVMATTMLDWTVKKQNMLNTRAPGVAK